ncbi:MAG: TetR/AcrR family transcriptional regulator C-terminal domain-containing protein [Microbacterium sp.]|uniref:TetR/AcrR family transcriptional regulator n=1 Tax=Microbacterium sp. TaxID=51671 RepID=UPI0039E270B1
MDANDDDVVALLWSQEGDRRTRPGPKPRLMLAQVVDRGISIADADGLDAVTMQRLADRLETTKMALYRYVPGRAGLHALMLDGALDAPPADGGTDWRAVLTRWALELFEQAAAHPWAIELAQRNHVPGPRELRWFESGLLALDGLPLTAPEKLDVLALLSGHAMSLAQRAVSASAPEADMGRVLAPVLAVRGADYPQTVAAFSDTGAGRDTALTFGIDRLLDGIDALVASR